MGKNPLKDALQEAYSEILTLIDEHHFDLAEVLCRQLLEAAPEEGEPYHLMGILEQHGNNFEAAESFIRKAIERHNNDARYWVSLGTTLLTQRLPEQAIQSFQTALKLAPNSLDAFSELGWCYLTLGNLDDAEKTYSKVLEILPIHTQALEFFFEHRNVIPSTKQIQMLEICIETFPEDPNTTAISFLLGKISERQHDYERAWKYFAWGAAKRRSRISKTLDIEIFQNIKDCITPKVYEDHSKKGLSTTSPLFIVGMPRSGTTLLEQILTEHPCIDSCGENPLLVKLLNLNKPDFLQIGECYLNTLKCVPGRYLLNKLPNNFLYLGFIKLAFPHAKIIHCKRNPYATCVSMFKQNFKDEALFYSDDLKELGIYYNEYLRLMEYWKTLDPQMFYDITYEDVVNGKGIKELWEYLELDFDSNSINFQDNKNLALTASAHQVRKPVYTDSVSLWKKYESKLGPLWMNYEKPTTTSCN